MKNVYLLEYSKLNYSQNAQVMDKTADRKDRTPQLHNSSVTRLLNHWEHLVVKATQSRGVQKGSSIESMILVIAHGDRDI